MKFAKKIDLGDFELDKKAQALVSKKGKLALVLPETFMNKSGAAAGKLVQGAKKMKDSQGKAIKAFPELVVVHDDLDIPLGKAKMSWNKSSGGHKGVQSVMNALGTEAFFRDGQGRFEEARPRHDHGELHRRWIQRQRSGRDEEGHKESRRLPRDGRRRVSGKGDERIQRRV